MIEDVLRVAAGASAEYIGGDQTYYDILMMSEKVNNNKLFSLDVNKTASRICSSQP